MGETTPGIIFGSSKRDPFSGQNKYQSNTIYKKVIPEDYDRLFADTLIKIKPPYEIDGFLDYHLNYFLKKVEDNKELFLKQMKYVIMPIIKKKQGKEVYVELFDKWIEEHIEESKKISSVNTNFYKNMSNFDYDIAFSFAGEQRYYVDIVAKELKRNSIKVFFADDEKVDSWGKYLPDYFAEIFSKKALFCVIFISDEYVKKVWTNHERKSALSRAIRQKEEYILPARFDNSEITGLDDVSYINLTKYSPYEFAELIIDKLRKVDHHNINAKLLNYIPKSERSNYVLKHHEISILRGFEQSRYKYRAIDKITQESGEEKEVVRKRLLILKDKGLVDLINRPKGQKWIITNNGKEYLEYYYYEFDESSGSGS
ncbi:MAG TPA: TIR domain-containing protein [Bacteroidales bacterium]|nr:TIR domain-containing protein [Bacteroidales bacterium]